MAESTFRTQLEIALPDRLPLGRVQELEADVAEAAKKILDSYEDYDGCRVVGVRTVSEEYDGSASAAVLAAA